MAAVSSPIGTARTAAVSVTALRNGLGSQRPATPSGKDARKRLSPTAFTRRLLSKEAPSYVLAPERELTRVGRFRDADETPWRI